MSARIIWSHHNLVNWSSVVSDFAATIVLVGATWRAALDVNTGFSIFVAFPYARTVALWMAAYVGVDWAMLLLKGRRFMWPHKSVYFVALWGFQELIWNIAFFASRWPLPLLHWQSLAVPAWYEYVFFLTPSAAIAALWLRHAGAVRIHWGWFVVLAVFEVGYVLAGVPIEQDVFRGTLDPGNWVWEFGYNLIVLPLYLLIFRERRLEQRNVAPPSAN